jgi:hypothetical protein
LTGINEDVKRNRWDIPICWHCSRLHFGIPECWEARLGMLISCTDYTNAGFLYSSEIMSEMLTTYVKSMTADCISSDVIMRDTHTAEIPRLRNMLIQTSLPSDEHSEIWTWL